MDENSEEYYYDVLSGVGTEGWQEVRVDLLAENPSGGGSHFQLYNTSTSIKQGNNGKLDLNRLQGWKVELTVAVEDARLATSGAILFDQLAFLGGGDLLGSSFFTGADTWEDTVRNQVWKMECYQSELSQNETDIALDDGIMSVDYIVEQVEAWGGYMGLELFLPNHAYFNLTNANTFHLGYRVNETASMPGRTHLRFIIADSSDSSFNCSDVEKFEWWYSFSYVLDEDQAVGQIELPLKGSTDAISNTFQWTGWA